MHSKPLYNKPLACKAVPCYQVWLPHFDQTPELAQAKLVPPVDLAYLWLCHRLEAYKADCMRLLGQEVGGALPNACFVCSFLKALHWLEALVTYVHGASVHKCIHATHSRH